MYKRISMVMLAGMAACSMQPPLAPDAKPRQPFAEFYQQFYQQVAAAGLNPALLEQAFAGKIEPYAPAIRSEANQPEIQSTFTSYVQKMLAASRRAQGAALYREHAATLRQVEARTGVPGSVIVALWGMESNFGGNMGSHPVVPALVTLAWSSDRGAYFASEALAALKVARQQDLQPQNLTGSWAGAMGQCQFMPSNYLKYATDGNGDGKADIWMSTPDVLASAGTFLQALGWQKDVPWRVPARISVRLPQQAGFNERGLSEPHAIAQWQQWGVVPKGQGFTALGSPQRAVRLYRPLGDDGPAYMLGPNFDVLLKWNYSSYFAASALLLAESIANNGELPDV